MNKEIIFPNRGSLRIKMAFGMGNEAGALMHKCRYKVFLITHVWHPLQNRSSFSGLKFS